MQLAKLILFVESNYSKPNSLLDALNLKLGDSNSISSKISADLDSDDD